MVLVPMISLPDPKYLHLPADLRRRLLDRAGTTAQLAALTFLLAVALGHRYASACAPKAHDAAAAQRRKGTIAAWLDRPVLPRTRTSRRATLVVAAFAAVLLVPNVYVGGGGQLGFFPYALLVSQS